MARGARRWRCWPGCYRPMMPHLAEEMHARLNPGGSALVADLPWPEADASLVKAER